MNEFLDQFHDFEILYAGAEENILYVICKSSYYNQILPTFPELIILNFTKFEKIECKYLEIDRDPEKDYKSVWDVPLKEIYTEYIRLIGSLSFDIQTASFDGQQYTLICNGLPYTGGGTITITAKGLVIKDINGLLVTSSQFNDLKIAKLKSSNNNHEN